MVCHHSAISLCGHRRIHFIGMQLFSRYFYNMPRDKRIKRDIHALNENGMVICNPRDKEAALRGQTEHIATYGWNAVTCRKCLTLVFKKRRIQSRRQKNDFCKQAVLYRIQYNTNELACTEKSTSSS